MAQRKITNRPLEVTKRVTLDCGPGLTEQNQTIHTDINYILRQYQKTGSIEHAKTFQGQYDDVSVQDFTEAMNMVTEATDMFNELPSSIRKITGSPAGFLEFTQDPANAEKLQEMGLIAGNDGLTAEGTPSGAPVDPTPAPTPVDTTVAPPPSA